MSSMNDNDDDGNIGDFSLPAGAAAIGRAAAVGVVGGGGTTTSFPPHGSNAAAAASASSAAWNDFGYSHAATRSNPTTNLSNDDDGVLDGIGMAASSSTTTPSMDDLQIHDHPMVSFSDTGGMGMAVAVATTTNYYDGSNEYYGDRMMMQHNQQQQQQQDQDVSMKFPPSSNSITANNNNIKSSNNTSTNILNEELNFHPDLPFLVTHWLSTFVPPPPPTTSTTTSSSTIISTTSPRQLATLPANDATEIDVLDDKRKEALKLIRHHASSLANAFQTLGAFGLSSSSSGTITHRSSTSSSIVGTQAISSDSAATSSSTDSLPCFYRPTTYADMTRKYSQLLNVAIPSTHGIIMEERSNNLSTHGYCLDRNGNRLGALLGTLVGASTREGGDMRNDSMKKGSTSNSIRNTPWSLLEASYEGLVSLLHQAEDGTERCNNSAIVPAVAAAAASSSTTTTANGEKRKGNSRSAKSTSFGLPGRKVGEHTPSSSSSSLMDAIHKGTNAYILSSGDIITSSMAGDNAHNADASLHYSAASIRAAVASRSYQKIRMDVHSQRKEVECNLMALQQSTKKQSELLVGDLGVFGGSGGSFGEPESNDPQRIVAHLNNRRATLQSKYVSTKAALAVVEREAKQLYKESTSIRRQYHDAYKMNGQPTSLHQILHDKSGSVNLGYGPSAHAPGKNNLVLPAILSRQYHPRHKLSSVSRTRLSVLKARLSHASTISCHLIYPVYCLKFDKTGKYFITGADDQVAKVFHLGAGPRRAPPVTTTTTFGDQYPALPFNYGANVRGAVLVCSLRGHAGVISDLDVSSDNSLLATASGDGDVRIWGLKDGWPVATLRGHKGGANWVRKLMFGRLVSLSMLPHSPCIALFTNQLGFMVFTVTVSGGDLW